MSNYAIPTGRVYLADIWQASIARDVVLVLSGTAFITLAAFVAIPLPFTPVPLALSSFAVLTTGAALGPIRGAISAAIYLLIGALGAPVFVGGQTGVAFPTFGYVVGFVIAAGLVGGLAKRKADRKVASTLALGALGSIVIYAIGAPWLAVALGIDLGTAMTLGVVPFLIGDAVKVIALAIVLPSAWKLVGLIKPDTTDRK